MDSLFSVGGPAFRELAVAQAASTAGDTLIALALAGTLFFSVPSAEARANVALYLLLTAAPFAVIAPGLGRLLARFPAAYRTSLLSAAAARVVVALVMIKHQDSLVLLPLAFVLLVLSRAHGISRNSLLPLALDRPMALVAANAALARVGVLGGVAGGLVGAAGMALTGTSAVLVVAAAVFGVATVASYRLPDPPPPTAPPSPRGRWPLPREVRLARLATAGVRFLNGYLLLLLAFALRQVDAGLADFGAVLGAAGLGFAVASVTSPYLERRLREEPMVIAALAVEASAAFIAAQWFGLAAASALAAAAGFAWGTAKLAFDGLLQGAVPSDRRGGAFSRAETAFQLAWVAGGVVPTMVSVPAEAGLIGAGLAALGAQVLYTAALLVPARLGARPGARASDVIDSGPAAGRWRRSRTRARRRPADRPGRDGPLDPAGSDGPSDPTGQAAGP